VFQGGLERVDPLSVRKTFQGERNRRSRRENFMVGGLIGLLIIVAIVLVLLKVAVAGGVLGVIAIVLLILLLLGRI